MATLDHDNWVKYGAGVWYPNSIIIAVETLCEWEFLRADTYKLVGSAEEANGCLRQNG